MSKNVTDNDDVFEFTDADFFSDGSDGESTESIVAAILEEPDEPPADNVPYSVVVEPEWLTDVRQLARKYGAFSTAQIMKIIPILMAGSDTRAESN